MIWFRAQEVSDTVATISTFGNVRRGVFPSKRNAITSHGKCVSSTTENVAGPMTAATTAAKRTGSPEPEVAKRNSMIYWELRQMASL